MGWDEVKLTNLVCKLEPRFDEIGSEQSSGQVNGKKNLRVDLMVFLAIVQAFYQHHHTKKMEFWWTSKCTTNRANLQGKRPTIYASKQQCEWLFPSYVHNLKNPQAHLRLKVFEILKLRQKYAGLFSFMRVSFFFFQKVCFFWKIAELEMKGGRKRALNEPHAIVQICTSDLLS